MITEIILPQLGDTMNEGTITHWYKHEGDAVKKGEPLFEVLTDKANIDVEATASGYLRSVMYKENESAPTGHVIAYLTTTVDEPLGTEQNTATAPTADVTRGNGATEAVVKSTIEEPAPDWAARKKQFVSPRARRLASEQGVDLALVAPSSRTGRIVEADVLQFLKARTVVPTPSPAVVTAPPAPMPVAPSSQATSGEDFIVPVAGVRKIIFDRMGASAHQVARVTLTTEADATRLVDLRAEINAQQQAVKFSFTTFFILLVSRALLKYPYMNATLRADGVHQHPFVNMGLAVDTERGLLVPVMRDAQRKGLGEIHGELARLSELARTGKIAPENLQGGTFTITNLGLYEIDAFTPIINQPETAILGIGRIAEKAAAYQGQLALRWMVTLSLAFDHRLVDGVPAAKFLQELKHLVETPGLVLV